MWMDDERERLLYEATQHRQQKRRLISQAEKTQDLVERLRLRFAANERNALAKAAERLAKELA